MENTQNIPETVVNTSIITMPQLPGIGEIGGTGKLIQLRSKDISVYRDLIIKDQKGLCAICNELLPLEGGGVSLDHQHKTKSETIGVEGAGLIRGVLCRNCNVFEGKIWNNSKRYGKFKTLPQFLRAVADYHEKENYPYIHPSEAVQTKKVSKRQYNLLVKAYGKQTVLTAKLPEFPGKRKPSQKLLSLFERFEVSPYV
jgi:hypothetical protein